MINPGAQLEYYKYQQPDMTLITVLIYSIKGMFLFHGNVCHISVICSINHCKTKAYKQPQAKCWVNNLGDQNKYITGSTGLTTAAMCT